MTSPINTTQATYQSRPNSGAANPTLGQQKQFVSRSQSRADPAETIANEVLNILYGKGQDGNGTGIIDAVRYLNAQVESTGIDISDIYAYMPDGEKNTIQATYDYIYHGPVENYLTGDDEVKQVAVQTLLDMVSDKGNIAANILVQFGAPGYLGTDEEKAAVLDIARDLAAAAPGKTAKILTAMLNGGTQPVDNKFVGTLVAAMAPKDAGKVLTAMDPKDAAAVLNTIDPELGAKFIAAMVPNYDSATAILEAMNPKVAGDIILIMIDNNAIGTDKIINQIYSNNLKAYQNIVATMWASDQVKVNNLLDDPMGRGY